MSLKPPPPGLRLTVGLARCESRDAGDVDRGTGGRHGWRPREPQLLYQGARGALPGMERDEGRQLDPATRYVHMFNAFFSRGGMTATYKPVFLKCLLDLGKYDIQGHNSRLPGSEWVEIDGDTVTLDLNFVAARLIRYYWDMDDSFRLRQTSNPGDAKIIQIVRKEAQSRQAREPPTLKELVSDSSSRIRQEAITHVIKKQVLVYLLTDMPDLYETVHGSNKIKLDADIALFLERHKKTILDGLNRKLTSRLGRLNTETPHGANESDKGDGAPISGAWQFLDSEQRQRCFYCDSLYWEGNPSMNHVIPPARVFFADLHNCVVACASCGLKKRERPPAPELFLNVLDRNDGLERRASRLPSAVRRSLSGYDGVWYRKTYTACLTEHHEGAQFFRP